MKYSELEDTVNFHRNMRRTPWLKLFPHWYDEKDALLNAIGDEVERVKAQAIFALLNAGIKPPVLLWQESLNNKKYNVQKNITKLPTEIKIDTPLYKTWGKITLTNNTEKDIDGLELMLDSVNGLIINQIIKQEDKIIINLYDNSVSLNGKKIKVQKKGQGMPYFITSQNYNKYQTGTPIQNEVIRLKINTDTTLEDTVENKTVNITEKVESWEVAGEAYQENPDNADPWIVMDGRSRIGYELSFDNIKKISFWYKAEGEAELSCYCNNEGVFNKNINDEWTYYEIDASQMQSIGKLEFENFSNSKIYINDIKYMVEEKYNFECDIDVEVDLDNAVFVNEQNIEITSLELIPIEKVELYAYYDFPFNSAQNGWKKVYQKKYEEKTNVIYDMITTHFPTKEFYVDVWFKTLQYPYKVGFPCYKDAELDSMYHVNNRLDTHGEELGLQRRMYKTDIPEEDYSTTFPIFYPFDIEQDYWYYLRLINEYTWNDLAINDVDITDTDGNRLFRLYSINPFCEDFVVHAKSSYPVDKEKRDCNWYTPKLVSQRSTASVNQQVEFSNIINLLTKDEDASYLSLNNKNGNYISTKTYQSKELWTYFDLSDLPEDVNIDNIEVEIEAESTDNKTNKYATKDTGLLLPNFNSDENSFIPLSTDSNYQLRKQVLTYSNNDIQQYVHSNEDSIAREDIEQKAIIGEFSARLRSFIEIPITLYENGEVIDDITSVYLYYNNNLKEGKIIEKDSQMYIRAYVPNEAIIDKITIICKSTTHKPFTIRINTTQKNKYKEGEEGTETEEVEYQYIEGPLLDGEVTTINYTESWRTDDLRNLLQKEGLYFRTVIQNDDEQSSTTIKLYNITLKICYSEKKSTFRLNTYVDVKNVESPVIGQYIATVVNTGQKALNTIVDIITPPNIHMEKNSFYVNLKPKEDVKETINITAEYPLVDGYYDIVTICEDKTKTNSINVFSDGLIDTGINIKPHHGKYYDTIKLSADVYAVDKSKISGGANQIAFYINGYMVGQPVQVINGHAEIEVIPGQYKFVDTGVLELEARYLGNIKYKSSRKSSTIFISKNNTRITLTASDVAIYQASYQVEAKVEYFNGERYIPVDDGEVVFYINDEILSANSTFTNGIFTSQIASLENPAGKYTLRAAYSGSETYSSIETTQDFEIIGGEADVFVFDVSAKPTDEIQFKAVVTDINGKTIPYGFLDFYIENPNKTLIQEDVKIVNGVAITDPWTDTTVLTTDDEKKIYTITAVYHGAKDLDIYHGQGTGSLVIEKHEVIIEYQPTYYATQYEPLGFFMRVKDAITNEYISDGTISITLPKQNNIVISETVDDDGGVRIVHNPLSFTAKEWKDLNKFSFTTAGEITSKQRITIEDTNIPQDVGVYSKDNLYMIYDGDFNEQNPLIDFIIEDNELYYQGDSDDKEHIFISESGHLYARTTLDSLRTYTIGSQDIIINYDSLNKYKSQHFTITDGLNIRKENIDLDIHSYDITYSDNEEIVCYTTAYDKDDYQTANRLMNNVTVYFVIDDITVKSVKSVDGMAVLPKDALYDIKAGNHLLSVHCITDMKSKAYSYEKLILQKETPLINITTNRITKNRKSNIYVTIKTNNANVPLNGLINLYMNDELIDNQYLYGNESLPGIVDYSGSISGLELSDEIGVCFTYIMPDDIDINEYIIKAKYEGNDYFTPATTDKKIKQEPAPVDIIPRHIKNSTMYVALGEECIIDVDVSIDDDIINEGRVILSYGDDIIASGNVINNVATLSWTQEEMTNHQYTLSYIDGVHYVNKKDEILNINVINALDEVVIPNNNYETLHDALRCIKNNGTIYIKDDIILDRQLDIKKDCNIIGHNDTCIIKDAIDLVSNLDSIYMYDFSNFDDDIYEVEGLTIANLNINDFVIQDKKLYLRKSMKEVYLLDDGKFYADSQITLDTLNSDININIYDNTDIYINNIHFKSNDNSNKADFIIQNNGSLIINHSILDKNIMIRNNGSLTAQRNFIYGECYGGGNLNNNWWGSNTPPYDVDNHIIIEVFSDKAPAVISENINIIGRMIGANERKYDLPSAEFLFYSDTDGYFSIDTGLLTNQKAKTTLLDATHEGEVYFKVDDECVSCSVYEYERKTEVIIDKIHEIPIHYQIPISAKVESCADTFYTSDGSTKLINEGEMYFYINDQQLGHVPVENGKASIDVFFTDKYYNINTDYTIKAVYKPKDYYFSSEGAFTTQLINDNNNVCYVSSLGDNTNNGTYGAPVKTLQQAISLNKSVIYLLDEYIIDSSINIINGVTIKAYKNNSIFRDLSGGTLFNVPENITLIIKNIDFINNSFTYLFDNKGSVHAEKCIFYKNDAMLFNNEGVLDVKYSAIVDNTEIANAIQESNFVYCWFGTDDATSINANINKYVVMDIESSKDILYIGTLAHITGKLSSYIFNDIKYKLEEELPLRVAKFSSDAGSMKPLYDYTYDNQSTSLLNTYEEENSIYYIITLPENKNYYDTDAIVKAHISNVYNDEENSDDNDILFEIYSSPTRDEESLQERRVQSITDNIASANFGRLPLGTYYLWCSYYKDNRIYRASSKFVVQKPDVIVESFNISGDNLYYTDINITLKDNFNNEINNEIVNVKIDNTMIGSYVIKNGNIQRRLEHSLLSSGKHTITIYNNDSTEYEPYSFTETLNVSKKNTTIIFPYKNIEANIYNNLEIIVNDDNGNRVKSGSIIVEFNDETIASKKLINGYLSIDNFKVTEIGQYPITIYYHDDNDYYNESLYVDSNIGVGIFNVKFGIEEGTYVQADIGRNFVFNTTVTDINNQKINHGYVNIYIDDIILNEEGISVNDGRVSLQQELPTNIAPGTHTFTIEYIDITDRYLDTRLNTFLIIDKIPTYVYMSTIHGSPNQKVKMNYEVTTDYGLVNNGTLIAKYNDTVIGETTVTDSIVKQMIIKVPFLPASEEYEVSLEYQGDSIYQDKSITTTLIVEKNEVVIEPSHTQYYPNTLFNLAGKFTDVDENMINVGKASLYIDNVQENEPQNIVNGQIMVPIKLSKAKTYKMIFEYEENEYYHKTRYEFDFNIESIEIESICFEDVNEETYNIINNVINTLPNQVINANIIFNVLDNYNVRDGIIDFYLDGQKINSYYVAENNKNVDLNIGNIDKGVHTLAIKYYNSNLFNDFEKEFTLNIIPQELSITINDGQPFNIITHNDIININTYLSKSINGIIKYYIGLPIYEGDEGNNIIVSDYNYKFIGLQEIIRQDMTYQYQLPKELFNYSIDNFENTYKIKAVFTGNNHYDETYSEVDLIIHKQDCSITFAEQRIYAKYKETINVEFDIDVENNPLINFYINDEMIDSVVVNNQHGTLKYKLNSKMIASPDPYVLTAVFNGSAINNPTQSSINIEVQAMQPEIDMTAKNAYIGGEILLNNQLTDSDNVIVEDDGTLSYTIMGQSATFNLNEEGAITLPYESISNAIQKLSVSYTPGDTTKYLGFNDKKIDVNLLKNDIKLDISAPAKVTRGKEFNVNISATSKTTNAPVNVPILIPYKDTPKNIENGLLNTSVTISVDTEDLYEFDLVFSTIENDIFNEQEKTITIRNENETHITINTEAPESNTNAHTLAKAINLVDNYEYIKLITPINNQKITLTKNINIDGNNNTVKDWQIINKADAVTISNLNIKSDTHNSNIVVNNGSIAIDKCTFENAKDSAVLINKEAIITDCIFKNNSAQNGGAIYISNRNHETIIDKCVFNGNSATVYGGAIYSDKGNDVDITYSSFYNNNTTNLNGASISINGNISLHNNTFYSNTGLSEVHLISGSINASLNLFNGTIKSLHVASGDIIDIDLNYWGYNDIEDIESHNPDVDIDNWLIAKRKDYDKEIDGQIKHIIVGEISQYINRLEKDITTIEPIESDLPVVIGTPYKLNKEIIADKASVLHIGQDEFNFR